MGTIQFADAATKAMANLTCLTIQTGNTDCIARFYPALYQLTLVKAGTEEKIDLGFSGSRLLERLVRNPGEVVDRDDLMNHAWPGRVVGQGSLNQQIYTLRQILADEKEREIIQTLPRRGYLLNPKYIAISMVEVDATSTEPETNEKPAQPAASSTTSVSATPTDTAITSPCASAKLDTHEPLLDSPAKPPTQNVSPTNSLGQTMLIGAMIFMVVGAFVFGKWLSTPTTAANKLTLTYTSHVPEELDRLKQLGAKLDAQLRPHITQPLHVVAGLHDDEVDVVCLQSDGKASALHINVNNIEQLAESELAHCLR
jgi:cholera toxin transcriptional activator